MTVARHKQSLKAPSLPYGSDAYIGRLSGGAFLLRKIMKNFVDIFNNLCKQINQNAKQHGFWEKDKYQDGTKIALMHSELSEALEALRHDNPPDEHCPEFSSGVIELADCVIRIMDFAAQKKWDLGKAIIAKHKFNKSRLFKHNKEF